MAVRRSKQSLNNNTHTLNSALTVNTTSGQYAINVDNDGYVLVDKLVLVDKKDGSKWDISIYDGELIYEPHGLENKRDFRIDKIIS